MSQPRVTTPARGGRSGIVLVAAVAVTLLAGCGGASDGQKRTERARYVTAADGLCVEANRAIAQHDRYVADLGDFAEAVRPSGEVLQATATDLHAERDKLGDSADAKIERFDRAIDPYASAVVRFAAAKDEKAIEDAAPRVRRRGDVLYRAARAADLESCGRGGNLIADRGITAIYVLAYRNIHMRTQYRVDRLRRAFDGTSPGPQRVAAASRITRVWRARYRSLGRLEPPRALRRVHQTLRRVENELLTAREVLEGDASAARKLQALDSIERLGPRVERLTRRLSKAAGINRYGILE